MRVFLLKPNLSTMADTKASIMDMEEDLVKLQQENQELRFCIKRLQKLARQYLVILNKEGHC